MVFGVFSPGRTHCIAPKKLPDKAMSIWNLHKKFQLSSAMGLRDFDLQSQPTLMGGNPLIVVHWLPKFCIRIWPLVMLLVTYLVIRHFSLNQKSENVFFFKF